jgi:hypothetical protein
MAGMVINRRNVLKHPNETETILKSETETERRLITMMAGRPQADMFASWAI